MDTERKAAEFRTICVGTIGAGYACRLHAQAWHMVAGYQIRLKTVVDVDGKRARRAKEQYGYQNAEEDYHKMLLDDDIDVIDICTPPSCHVEMIKETLLAGKHVICEKPLSGYFGRTGDEKPTGRTVSKRDMLKAIVTEMDELAAILKVSQRQFFYAENYVYAPAVQKAIEMVRHKRSKVLFLKAEESLKGSGSLNAGEWSQIGGGALIRAGVHPLSAVLAIKRAEAEARGEPYGIDSVTADVGQATKCLKDGYEHRHIAARPNDVEDFACVTITFLDGTKATVTASDLVLGGTKGYVEVYTNDSAICCNVSPTDLVNSYFLDEDQLEDVAISEMLPCKLGWNYSFVADEIIRGFCGEMQNFAECIATGRKPVSGYALACEILQIVYAAYLSAEEGKKLTLRGGCVEV